MHGINESRLLRAYSGNFTGLRRNPESYRLSADFGIADQWSAAVSVGYYRTESGSGGPFTVDSHKGLADTCAGVRRALLTQQENGFDLARRVGVTLPGDYETGQLSAPGDDASGMDVRLLAGHSFGSTRIEGYLGYTINEGAVPESLGLGVSTIQKLGSGFAVEAGYRFFDSDGDLDFGGPGFAPARRPEVSEQGGVIEGALIYVDRGNRYYRAYISQRVDGKNIGREETYGLSVTFGF